jgi:D-alanyl-D-alanine dipeptidase
MADSIRERIIQAVATAVGTVDGITVFRSRMDAVTRDEGPVLVIRPANEEITHTMQWDDRILTLELILLVRGPVPDKVADPIASAIFAAVVADRHLGGLAVDLTESQRDWGFEEADDQALELSMQFDVMYRTSHTSETTLGN